MIGRPRLCFMRRHQHCNDNMRALYFQPRCFAFQIGKIHYRHCIVRIFQFRKSLPAHSNTIILHPLSGRSPRFNTRLFALRCHKIPFCLSFTSFHLIFSLRPAAIRRQDDAFPHHELSAIRDRPPRTISDTRTISKFLRPVNRHSPQIQTLIFYLVSHEKFV